MPTYTDPKSDEGSNEDSNEESQGNSGETNILIAYFTRVGNTDFDANVDATTSANIQIVFCDQSTPGPGFNVYDDMRDKLMRRGIPKEEITFIHEADSDAKKARLFADVRAGKVRVLMGSTAKLGAGTNAQDKLVALHHIDVPWRPSDVGRALRIVFCISRHDRTPKR